MRSFPLTAALSSFYSDISTLLNRGNGKTHDIVVRRDGEKITLRPDAAE